MKRNNRPITFKYICFLARCLSRVENDKYKWASYVMYFCKELKLSRFTKTVFLQDDYQKIPSGAKYLLSLV